MIKVFDKVEKFETKVNYVDSNNVVLGYDMNAKCCETFGHGVFKEIPQGEITGYYPEDTILEQANLDKYNFVDEPPKDCLQGEGKSFRIVANNKPDLFVVIWNCHNGYYSHGFSFQGKEDCI